MIGLARASCLVALLAGCARSPEAQLVPKATHTYPRTWSCVTACGMRADVDEGSCKSLRVTEARALISLTTTVVDFRDWPRACLALKGWTVREHAPRTRLDAPCGGDAFYSAEVSGCVYGLSRHDRHEIELADDAWPFDSLTHEIAHVLDSEFGTAVGVDHCGWTDRKIYRAIADVVGEYRSNPEECP